MKGISTAWLRVAVVLVVLIGLALALLQWAVSGIDDLKGLALNLGTEMIGAAVTYVLLELFIRRREEEEVKKAELINQLRSQVLEVAAAAAEELRRHGWLTNGSLQGADLDGANLQGADLYEANLRGAKLRNANLQGTLLLSANLEEAKLFNANLQWANLREANLLWADLRANLRGANLVGADLQGTHLLEMLLDEDTTLPDGTKWTPDTDMARFTDPKHPDFWSPDA